jgi:hypothetical protein
MRTRSILLALTLGATLAIHAAPAAAQDTSQMSEEEKKNVARTLGEEGQKAFDAKSYPRAEQLFRDAEKAFPAPTLTLGLARTLAAQGKLVAAVETYNRIIREWGPKTDAPAPFKAALDTARSEVGPVTNRLGNLTLTIEPANAPNLKLTLDDKPFPNAMLGVKRQIDPGSHVLKASADGFKTAEKPFPIAEGANADVKVTLEAGTGAAVVPPPGPAGPNPPPPGPGDTVTPPPSDAPASGGNGMKYAAYGAFGLAGAGLVVGSITGIVAMGKASSLKDVCRDGKCPSSEDSNISSYKTMATVSTVGFIVAGVGAAAGAVLFITAPKSSGALGNKTDIGLYVGPGSLGAAGRF